jgi:actin related protein 2/3 complex subunit 1A/1B
MSSFEENQLIVGPITTHAWNGDRSRLAISPNNDEVHIYKRENGGSGGFSLEHVLKEHDKLVTSIDWAPRTNRIVSCSQDRNAYVWSYDEDKKEW